jgi:hypothetical protein
MLPYRELKLPVAGSALNLPRVARDPQHNQACATSMEVDVGWSHPVDHQKVIVQCLQAKETAS